jgi:hypothetical protein
MHVLLILSLLFWALLLLGIRATIVVVAAAALVLHRIVAIRLS